MKLEHPTIRGWVLDILGMDGVTLPLEVHVAVQVNREGEST